MGCACRGAGNWPFLGARWEPASVPAERGVSQPPFSRDPLEGGAQGREKPGACEHKFVGGCTRQTRGGVRPRLRKSWPLCGWLPSQTALPAPPSALPSTLAAVVHGHREENNWSCEEGGRWGTPAAGMLWGGASSENRSSLSAAFPNVRPECLVLMASPLLTVAPPPPSVSLTPSPPPSPSPDSPPGSRASGPQGCGSRVL